MIRTQIQMTERQAVLLKQVASSEQVSMADIVRRSLDDYLRTRLVITGKDRARRAIAIAGRFRSGTKKVSSRHDAYLAEAFAQ